MRTDKGIGSNHVQSGYTTKLSGVVHALLLQNFGGNGDSGVDRVADNGKDCVGAKLGAAFDKSLDNSGVDL
jgi:hypothetical protein